MKKHLFITFLTLFTFQISGKIYAMEIPEHAGAGKQARTLRSVCACAAASKILDQSIDLKTALKDIPDDCKRILYTELIKQAELRWPNANWYDISTINSVPDSTISSSSVALSHDGQYLASGSNDHTVKIYHQTAPNIWTLLHTFDSTNGGHTDAVLSVAFSPDVQYFASGSNDHTVKIYHQTAPNTWTLLHTFDSPNGGHTDSVWSTALSADGQYLASGLWDRTVKIYHKTAPNAWTFLHAFDSTNGGHTDTVTSVTLSADGQYLASSSWDHTVKIYHQTAPNTWTLLHTFDSTNGGHTDTVASVTLSADGQYLASGSYNHTFKIYHRRFGKFEEQSLEKLLEFIQSQDGSGSWITWFWTKIKNGFSSH